VLESELSLDNMNDDEIRKYIRLFDLRDKRIEFATKYHVNTNGNHLVFDQRFKYMREIYESISPKIVLQSGTQLGKSDWLVCDFLASSYLGLSAMVCFPKMDFRARFVKEKVKRPLNLSQQYKAILKDSLSDAIDLIQFGKGMISFVSANNSQDFTSYSAHSYYVEELDQAESVENVNLGFHRLDGSIYGFWRLVANPINTSKYRINYWYEKSDKRVWQCPCKKCGQFSDLDFFTTVVEELKDEEGNVTGHIPRDREWFPGCGRDMRVICPHCNEGELDRFSEDCRWQPTAYSEEGISGYHMPALISTLHDVSKIWHEFKSSKDDPTSLAKFYSTRLALPFSTVGNKVSVNVLQRCADEETTFEIHPDCAYESETHDGPCSMGIDQNATTLDIRISSSTGGKRKAEFIGKIAVENEYMLYDLIDRYNVEAAVIDNEPNTILSKSFQEKAKCEVWRCKYKSTPNHSERTDNHNIMLISIHRTELLDRAYSQLRTRKNILPENFESIFKGLYASEMQSLVRKTGEKPNGEHYYYWSFSNVDHSRHSDAYDWLAWDMINQDKLFGKDIIYFGEDD